MCAVLRINGDSDIKKEDDFYEQLHRVQEKPPVDDMVMCDLNIKVDCDAHLSTMGRHGLGDRNNNGERCVVWIDREKFAAT